MTYSRTDYYAEGLSESLEAHGVTATAEQIRAIAEDVAGYAENAGQAFYQPADPGIGEAQRLRGELERERRKIICRECKGNGIISFQGPHHGSTSTCWKCNGEGWHAP